jgi:hypothetical protein
MCVRQMRPPGRGDCWILKIAHAPSPKNLFKNGFCPRKGVAFLRKAFLQKNFQVREKIPLSALAFGCSHALVAEGFKEPSASQEPDWWPAGLKAALPLRATRRTGSSQGPGPCSREAGGGGRLGRRTSQCNWLVGTIAAMIGATMLLLPADARATKQNRSVSPGRNDIEMSLDGRITGDLVPADMR